jgi:hypothetical protein
MASKGTKSEKASGVNSIGGYGLAIEILRRIFYLAKLQTYI